MGCQSEGVKVKASECLVLYGWDWDVRISCEEVRKFYGLYCTNCSRTNCVFRLINFKNWDIFESFSISVQYLELDNSSTIHVLGLIKHLHGLA